MRFAWRSVAATFPDRTRARSAIESLQLRGVDGGEISILGSAAEHADADAERDRPDQRVTGYVGRRVLIGGLIGLGVGLLVGAAVAAVFAAASDAAWSVGAMVGSIMMGGFLGGTLGALWNAYRTVGMNSDAWQATFHDADGDFDVVVACRSEDEVARAAAAVVQAGCDRLVVVDEHGSLDESLTRTYEHGTPAKERASD